MNSRNDLTPTWINRTGNPEVLERVAFGDRDYSEDFLQRMLHQHPGLLAVSEVDDSFGAIVSLGREIDQIDNLFVTADGRLVLVETKLWRNPEATRTVVAQILEYAVRMAERSYEELEQLLRRTGARDQGSLFEDIRGRFGLSDDGETSFIDSVQRNLKAGRFMLLIVGDGIKEGIEALLEPLKRAPQLQFTFGLIEMQMFRAASRSGETLLVPRLIGRTTEVVRAVVVVKTEGPAEVSVSIEDDDEPAPGRRTLTEASFLQEVEERAGDSARDTSARLLDGGRRLGAVAVWRSAGVSLRLPDPAGSTQKLTLLVLTTSGEAYTGWLSEQLEKVGGDPGIAGEFTRRICNAFPEMRPKVDGSDTMERALTAQELSGKTEAVLEALAWVIDSITESLT